jgi:serine/threonine protein kinase
VEINNSAVERIHKEIKAMSEASHPNLISIIDVDPDYKWYVSKFYPNGSLDKNRDMFKGNVLSALKAIRPLVQGVALLHAERWVHRDIKPHNVFLDSENQLILGDFGLVYFEDNQKTRVSGTFENVGSRDWMPGWAYGIRVDKVKPSFDVFGLGKLLWSMISGLPIIQLWYFNREQFNVESLFPENQYMKFANKLFSKCIVENEEDCLSNAEALFEEVEKAIKKIEMGAEPLSLNIKRTCRVCGIGKYRKVVDGTGSQFSNFGISSTGGTRKFRIFECTNCGHAQIFSYPDELPPAWEERSND